MITRTQIRQFLAVVDGGSFTRAAELINVTQPTLSTGVAELEKHLGTKLFIREKRRIQLTEAGNRLLIHARKIQREFRLAEDETTAAAAVVDPIRLGVLESLATPLLEAIVFDFHQRGCENPLSIIEGKEAELSSSLSKNTIDAAITLLDKQTAQTDAIALFSEPYMLMVSDQHRIANQPIVSPQEISNETMMARRSCEILSQTSKYFTSHGARPPFSLRSGHEDRIMAMVRAGLGMTVAPLSHRVDGVTAVQLEGFAYKRTLGLVIGKNSWPMEIGGGPVLEQVIIENLKPESAPQKG